MVINFYADLRLSISISGCSIHSFSKIGTTIQLCFTVPELWSRTAHLLKQKSLPSRYNSKINWWYSIYKLISAFRELLTAFHAKTHINTVIHSDFMNCLLTIIGEWWLGSAKWKHLKQVENECIVPLKIDELAGTVINYHRVPFTDDKSFILHDSHWSDSELRCNLWWHSLRIKGYASHLVMNNKVMF